MVYQAIVHHSQEKGRTDLYAVSSVVCFCFEVLIVLLPCRFVFDLRYKLFACNFSGFGLS